MNDSTDKLMQLWLTLPDSERPWSKYKIQETIGQFDIGQPVMKGIAEGDGGDEIPFFCLLVEMQSDDYHGVATLSNFRMKGKWISNIRGGTTPSFVFDEKSPTVMEDVQKLLSGQCLDGHTKHLHLIRMR